MQKRHFPLEQKQGSVGSNYYERNITMIRKLLFYALVGAAALSASAQNYEPPVTYGVRLGMDVTFPGGSADPYKVGSGFTLGGVARVAMPRDFFFEPGLMIQYTAMTADEPVAFDDNYLYQNAAKYWNLHIPMLFGYSFSLAPQWGMSIATGPYVNVNLSARQQLLPNLSVPDPLPDRKVNLFNHGWRRVDAGWSIKLSVVFARSYYIGISTGIAFTPLARYGNRDNKMRIHRNTLAVSLGYNF